MIKARVRVIANQILGHILALPFLNRFRTRTYHTDYYVVEGKTKWNKCELRALVFGSSEFLHYLTDLVYSEQYNIKRIGRTSLRKIALLLKEFDPDLALAEFHEVFSDAMSKHFLILPELTWVLEITPSLEILVSKMKRLRRRHIKAIRGEDFTYEYTDSPEKFDFFYNSMYAPYVSNTHGKATTLKSEELARKDFQSGGLFLVKSEGEYVSGILFSREHKTIQCRLLGTKLDTGRGIDGQAALYGLINWAKQEGCTEIDYGPTPPFAGDGLFQYKRTWGMRVKPLSYRASGIRAFGMRLGNVSDGTLDFLSNNPIVFTCSSDLAILALLNVGNIDLKALSRRYYTPGLARFVAVHHKTNGQEIGMSSLDSSLEQLLATLTFKQLQENGYCAHVLEFSQSNTEEDAQETLNA